MIQRSSQTEAGDNGEPESWGPLNRFVRYGLLGLIAASVDLWQEERLFAPWMTWLAAAIAAPLFIYGIYLWLSCRPGSIDSQARR